MAEADLAREDRAAAPVEQEVLVPIEDQLPNRTSGWEIFQVRRSISTLLPQALGIAHQTKLPDDP